MGERAIRYDPVSTPRVVQTKRRRVLIEDARRDGSYLRVTWHSDGHVFTVSTWRDEVCTGAIRVPAKASPDLIALLVDGLADAAASPVPPAKPTRSVWEKAESLVRQWWRGKPKR